MLCLETISQKFEVSLVKAERLSFLVFHWCKDFKAVDSLRNCCQQLEENCTSMNKNPVRRIKKWNLGNNYRKEGSQRLCTASHEV